MKFEYIPTIPIANGVAIIAEIIKEHVDVLSKICSIFDVFFFNSSSVLFTVKPISLINLF